MHLLRHALTPTRALLLAGVLLLAQAAGLAHRVAHAGIGDMENSHAVTAPAAEHGHGLGNHQQAGTECRLLDQLLAHADALPTAALAVLPPTAEVSLAAAPQLTLRAARTAAYQARVPPAA